MDYAIVTGSGGLIGSEAARFLTNEGMKVLGVDNDMRRYFFGENASTQWAIQELVSKLGNRYEHFSIDIRDRKAIEFLVKNHKQRQAQARGSYRSTAIS
jgi:CDP-paratose 2-epimerase